MKEILERIEKLLIQIEENTRKRKCEKKKNAFDPGASLILTLFNHICVPPLKQANENKLIIEHCNARWKEHNSSEFWNNYFQLVLRSDFLLGKNDKGWQATLLWLISPKNFLKVLNGNYESNKKKSRWS